METLFTALALIFVLLLLAALIGLINPGIIKQPNRGRVMAVTLIPAFFVLLIFGVFAPDKQTNSTPGIISQAPDDESVSGDYKIVKDEAKRDIKRVVEVVLKDRVDEPTLRRMANEIHEDGFQRTFVIFKLEGTEVAGWATASFNPDLDIRFIGSTKKDHDSLLASDLVIDGEIIGRWLVDWGYEYKLAIYRRGGEIYQKTLFTDGSGKETLLMTRTLNGEDLYFDEGSQERGEYYTIAKNGDLEFWSENGNYYTAPRDF